MSNRSARRAGSRLVGRAVESLERRTLLAGNPTMAWELDRPAQKPMVGLDPDGLTWATDGWKQFRGINLTTPDAVELIDHSSGVYQGRRQIGTSDYTTPSDGNYEFRLPGSAFSPALPDELVTTDFFVAADFNRDRVVDFDDMLILAANYEEAHAGSTYENTYLDGDSNGDGLVDFNDMLAMANRYNRRLSPAPAYAGQVEANSDGLIADASQADGTRTPLTIMFKSIDDVIDDPDTVNNETATITGYSVFRSLDSVDFEKIGDVPRNGAQDDYTYTDNTAVDGAKYWYRIRPYFHVPLPDGSPGVQHLPTTNKVWKVAALGGASGLVAQQVSNTILKLKWTDGTQHEAGYRIYTVTSDGTRILRQTLPANATTATISGLDAGTSYRFSVVAFTDGIESMPAMLDASPSFAATPTTTADAVHVQWLLPAAFDPATHDGVHFVIEREANGDGNWSVVSEQFWSPTYPDDALSFDDWNVSAGTTYTYRITATLSTAAGVQTPLPSETYATSSVFYQRQAQWYARSTTATLIWPLGQTPPAMLRFTITDRANGQVTQQDVGVSPLAPDDPEGSGKYVVTGLTAGRTYDIDYAILGTLPSDGRPLTSPAPARLDTESIDAPAPPATASVELIPSSSSSAALVTWTPSPDEADLTSYTVWIRRGDGTSGGRYQEYGRVGPTEHAFTLLTEMAGAVSVAVTADIGTVHSNKRVAAGNVTLLGTNLPAPLGLASAGTATTERVDLSWQPVPYATRYLVEWSNGSEWFAIDSVTATNYTDELPTLGQQSYRVRAVYGDFTQIVSEGSAPIDVRPLAAPVVWAGNNGGANVRETLAPVAVRHGESVDIYVNAGDYDRGPGESPVTVADWTEPSHGTVEMPYPGVLRYTADDDYAGGDTFEVTVTDGIQLSPSTEIAIDVTNAAPELANYYTIAPALDEIRQPDPSDLSVFDVEDRKTTGYLPGYDSDGDTITYRISEGPVHGAATIDASTGGFVYDFNASFNGYDQFTVVGTDGITESAPVAVRVVLGRILVSRPVLKDKPHYDYGGFGSFYGYTSAKITKEFDYAFEAWDRSGEIRVSVGQELMPWPEIAWALDGDVEAHDRLEMVGKIGPIEAKPQIHYLYDTRIGDLTKSWAAKFTGNVHYDVTPTQMTTFQNSATGLKPADWNGSLTLERNAEHGDVSLNASGGFTYTPPGDDEGAFLGWDFFKIKATDEDGVSYEQWIQMSVGLSGNLSPTALPRLPYTRQSASSIAGTTAAITAGIDTAKDILADLLDSLGELGQGVGNVADASDLEIIDALDDATGGIDGIAEQYDDYLDQMAGLEKAAGEFAKSQWWWSEADGELLGKIAALPVNVGSLRPSRDQMEELVGTAKARGEGAAVAVNYTTGVVEFMQGTERVLTAAQIAGGLTMLATTGAQLLVKEGLKACAKAAAKGLIVEVAQGTAAAGASALVGYAASAAGLNLTAEQQHYLKVGLQAFQVFSMLKAARSKVDWDGACFVAGTQVLVGYDDAGSPITRNIEDLRDGDYILSRDQHDAADDVERHRVTNVFRKTSDHIRTLTIRDASGNVETIQTTDEHPFWVDGRGWTGAGELAIGATLDRPDGSDATVIATTRQAHAAGVTVYNIEVAGDHTYFVADADTSFTNPVWVHNTQTCIGEKWIAKGPGGKPVEFEDVQPVQFFKRSDLDYAQIRNEFDRAGGRRDQWLESIGLNPATRTQLLAAGMTPSQIDWMVNSSTNKLPSGWQVHHKHGIKLGGDNDDDNLIIFRKKDSFYHSALTNEQASIQASLENDGDVIERAFPMFNGQVIFTNAD